MQLPEVKEEAGSICAQYPSGRSSECDEPPLQPNSGTKTIPVVMRRQGLTLFAWNRGAVLEDRFLDRVMEGDGQLVSTVDTTNQVVTRLIRSCPENLRNQFPARLGVNGNAKSFPLLPAAEGHCFRNGILFKATFP